MSQAAWTVWRVVLSAGLTFGAAGYGSRAIGQVPRPGAGTEIAGDARFVGSEIEMPLDVTRPVRVVPVTVGAVSESDRLVSAMCDQATVLGVERQGRILPGQTMGYVLVRPLGVGEATLHIGESVLKIRVVAPGAAIRPEAFGPTPRLIAPSGGAGVWGSMRVAAAYWRIPTESGESAATIRLRVGEGATARLIDPVWTSAEDNAPLVLASFPVDFTDTRPGPCVLRAVRTDAAGIEHESERVSVQVVAPKPDAIVEGECESDYGLMAQNVIGPPKAPPFSVDKTASGGRYLNNAGADPRFRFPLEVASDQGAGWYQVVLTAGGDAACQALPSIGITIDEAQRPITASAIAQPGWHRIAIGTPVFLQPGFHSVRCDYVNDFAARGTDRNLRLDRIEIARVAGDSGGGAERGGSAMAASMQAKSAAATPPPPSGGDAMMSMMGGAASGSSSSGWPASARAGTRPPVRIAFERPIDGQPITGEIEIRGTVWWEDQRTAPPPVVALVINGHEVQRHRSDAPRFVVGAENFEQGENTAVLRAIADNGFTAQTASQQLFRTPSTTNASVPAELPRQSVRFTVHDQVWSPAFGKNLKENQGGEQRKSGPIASSSQIALELPDSLAGDFDLWIESHGNGRDRRMHALLETGTEREPVLPERPVASRDVPSWFDPHRFTTDDGVPLHLAAGPKRLILAVPAQDGGWVSGKGDKSAVWLQGVRLVERLKETRFSTPQVALDYPQQNTSACGSDAIVASVSDDYMLDWAEAVIDRKPTGLRFDVRRTLGGIGRVLVPLSLRDVPPGDHEIQLRVADMRGRVGESPARKVQVLSTPPAEGTPYDRVVILLDRFGYGPDPRELADALRLGTTAYLESRLSTGTGEEPTDAAAADLADVKFSNPRSGYDVPRRAIQQAIATGNPVRNRFTLWAENHFSTWIRKDEAWRKQDEHDRFVNLGVARFYDLLSASSTSPAMLRYLDQERSYGGRLNENYAREIMELHTLGVHGGYSQQDVTNLAHVLTGWTTARTALASRPDATPDDDGLAEDFRFDPVLSENLSETRDVVGYRFTSVAKADRHQRVLLALEILAAHPATAKFVCTKLASHYVAVPPPTDLVEDLSSVFTRTGGDMKQVLIAMSEHPAFWLAARARRLSHPTDYAFRLARTTGWMNPHEIGDFLGNSGHGLFDRPTPDGYPELDAEAMDSNAILQRWKLASRADSALADSIPPSIRWSNETITPELRQSIVDLIAIRLTGRLLSESSNTQALQVLEQSQPQLPPTNDQLARDPQIRTVAAFIAQMPEANVR